MVSFLVPDTKRTSEVVYLLDVVSASILHLYCLVNLMKYEGNYKINLRLVGKKKRAVIAPKCRLNSNK